MGIDLHIELMGWLSFMIGGFIIYKFKNFMMKDIDSGLILAVIICFPLGIAKITQTENPFWSNITGIFLIVSSLIIVFDLIKRKGKRT